jgi:serine/threonine protein kinase
MELAAGGSLHRELRLQATPRPWEERLADARAILLGLVAVHDAGIVHRDLTPQNILRFSDGRLAIADFGLAVDEPGKTTIVAGTPNYIAPEVLSGARASFASDVWQLGMIMHEVLFGRRAARQEAEVATTAAERPFLDLCLRCVSADLAHRLPNAGAVAHAWVGVEAERKFV